MAVNSPLELQPTSFCRSLQACAHVFCNSTSAQSSVLRDRSIKLVRSTSAGGALLASSPSTPSRISGQAHSRSQEMLASRRCAGASAQRSRSFSQPQPHSLGSSSIFRPLPISRHHVGVSVAASSAELQQMLAAKEQELAAMFESGRPMPQASVVAALRSEIAALDAQINGRPIPEVIPMPANVNRPSRGPGSFSPGLAGPGSFGGQVGSRPPGSGPPASSGAVRSRTEQLADKAYEMVEQQMRASQGMGQEDDMEIARLEHENTQLRAQAYELLQRQQQLESMLAEVRGQKEPELLLDTAESLLARMKAKLQKA